MTRQSVHEIERYITNERNIRGKDTSHPVSAECLQSLKHSAKPHGWSTCCVGSWPANSPESSFLSCSGHKCCYFVIPYICYPHYRSMSDTLQINEWHIDYLTFASTVKCLWALHWNVTLLSIGDFIPNIRNNKYWHPIWVHIMLLSSNF